MRVCFTSRILEGIFGKNCAIIFFGTVIHRKLCSTLHSGMEREFFIALGRYNAYYAFKQHSSGNVWLSVCLDECVR